MPVEGLQNETSYVELTFAVKARFGLQVEASEDNRCFRIPAAQHAALNAARAFEQGPAAGTTVARLLDPQERTDHA